MFQVGDFVIYSLDGSVGTVVEVEQGRCHVVWDDHFVSWEKNELLIKDESINHSEASR
jgi:hypothetical protein